MIIDSGSISSYTSINEEKLIWKRSKLRKTVNGMIDALAFNQLSQVENHCYGCRPPHGMGLYELEL